MKRSQILPIALVLFTAVARAETPVPLTLSLSGAQGRKPVMPELRKQPISCFASALPAYHIEDSADGVIKALSRPEVMARVVALMELGSRGTEQHISAVLPLLDDPDAFVRRTAVRTVNCLVRDVPSNRTVEARSRAMATARELFRTTVNAYEKVEVAGLLAAAGDAAGYEVVVDGLQSKYPFQALLAILNFLPLETRDKEGKPVDWVKPLARVLNSPSRSQSTRHDAVCVLGRIATPAARATLSERLKVEEDIVVRMCIKTVLWPPKVFASPNDPAFQRAG